VRVTDIPGESLSIDALYAAATDAYRAREFARAIPLYERAIAVRPDHAEAHYKCANARRELGQLAEALAHYDAAVSLEPRFANAWCNRGAVQQSLAQYEAALASYDRAMALEPSDVLVHCNRGGLLQFLSRWEEALASYDRALALDPELAQVWFHRGNVLRRLGRLEEVVASYSEVTRCIPENAEAHYNLGVAQELLRRTGPALTAYDRALALNPELGEAEFNRAGVLKSLGQLDAALASYDRVIARRPDFAEAHLNRGVVLQELERRDEALACYERALAIRPDHAQSFFNRAGLLATEQQWARAMADYDRAIALQPDFAAAYGERGRLAMDMARFPEALADFERALAMDPELAEVQYHRARALLQIGDYRNGWANHEWRWKSAQRLDLMADRVFDRPLWLGAEPIAGKTVLLYPEQGLGDTLQFCRFAASVAARGATVILEAPAELADLLESLPGLARVVTTGEPLPAHDYRCPLMSLPLALGTTLETIPAPMRYLSGDAGKVARWHQRLGTRTRPRVGLTWSGNPRFKNDAHRSFGLAPFIGYLPRGFDYFCLQKDIRPADRKVLADHPEIQRFDAELDDFSDTAALCECLDLVISSDTSVPHLSAALGKPTWILLGFTADWRWLLDRADSPWYPTVTLYRQHEFGDWQGVFERVGQDLQRFVVT
jgi:tetratricopeptide (TPR) repeat protein